jgi:hypothetical protein
MLRLRNKIDLAAGLLLVAVALFFISRGAALRMGTASEMGPGFFPALLSWVLLLLGIAMAARAFSQGAAAFELPGWRPLLTIVAGPALFGLLVTKLGLFLTIVIVALVGRLGLRERLGLESAIVAVLLAAFCSVVFVVLLGQPIALWP